MSKIPQGEWNAIAARYQSGESISKIARSYGCTPPAIHYILKRSRIKSEASPAQPAIAPRSAEPPRYGLVRAHAAEPPTSPAQSPASSGAPDLPSAAAAAEVVPSVPLSPEGGGNYRQPLSPHPASHGTSAVTRAAKEGLPPASTARVEPAQTPAGGKAVAPRGRSGLDVELYSRAEAAIELFRTSFSAAMTEGSPGMRERLRQAANDLMRVAARTTMVLDRLNAISERTTAVRSPNYPRSALAGEDFNKLG